MSRQGQMRVRCNGGHGSVGPGGSRSARFRSGPSVPRPCVPAGRFYALLA